jgi:DNA-binding LacI/PurR family transcriptional regulator
VAAIRDVARLAGVSTTTVSHVINGTHYVSEPLRGRVLDAMRQLNYRPSIIARSLRTKATHSIGLIVSDIELPFFATLARGVQDASAEHGRTVILCNTDEAPDKEAAYLNMMWGKRVDGLIIAPTGANRELLSNMQSSGVPIVLVDRRCPGLAAPLVGIDNRRAACEGTRYLIELGHRRIGLIAGLSHVSTITERVAGFRQAYAEAGLEVDEELIRYSDSRPPGGRLRTEEFLSLEPPVTAIFATVAFLTLGALQVLRARRVRCPQDMSVLGFDDPDWAVISAPAVTSIRQPSYEMGHRAAEVLARLIDGDEPDGCGEILLESRLIVRESVACLGC